MKTTPCTLLFLKKQDQILLAMKKRGFGQGRWNGVGGKIDKNEQEVEAVIRESEEEIRVTPNQLNKVAKLKFINKDDNNKPYLIIVHVYFCEDWTGEPTETEEMTPKWYSLDEIPYTEMWEDDAYWLPKVLDGKKVEATFEFDQNDHIIYQQVEVVDSL